MNSDGSWAWRGELPPIRLQAAARSQAKSAGSRKATWAANTTANSVANRKATPTANTTTNSAASTIRSTTIDWARSSEHSRSPNTRIDSHRRRCFDNHHHRRRASHHRRHRGRRRRHRLDRGRANLQRQVQTQAARSGRARGICGRSWDSPYSSSTSSDMVTLFAPAGGVNVNVSAAVAGARSHPSMVALYCG